MGNKIKMLIAESDIDFRNQMKKGLENSKYLEVVDVASTGRELVRKVLDDEHIDVIVTEYVMPDMDGLYAIRKIREERPNNRAVYCMLTAFASNRVAAEASELGVDYFMVKPISLDYFIERMENVKLRENELTHEKYVPVFKSSKENIVDKIVVDNLMYIGVPCSVKGFAYIKESINLLYANDEMASMFTKILYPEIARKFNTTSTSVERAIRHAISIAWEKGNRDGFTRIFGCVRRNNAKPTNSEFISTFLEMIKIEIKKLVM